MPFNYYDELRKGSVSSWISYLNNHYMETHAPSVLVFKLDKEQTDIDDLYGGENFNSARIYLPPFEIRMNYLEGGWTQQLGVDTMPYLEMQEEDTLFAVNFEAMVNKIREVKFRNKSNLFIEYIGSKEVSALKQNNILILKVNDEIIKDFNLEESEYRTISKLNNEINKLDKFKSNFEGENDISINLVDFKETRFKSKKIDIFSIDDTYKNCTDIIEKGDLILTDKYFLFEVESNLPGGNIGWDYSMMLLKANTRSLDKAELPNNWNQMIANKEYGLRDKIKME